MPDVKQVVSTLNETGVVELAGFIDAADLETCRKFVTDELEARGARYFSLTDADRLEHSPFAKVIHQGGIDELLRAVCAEGHSDEVARDGGVYNVLRVLTGATGAKQAHLYHYDATVLTALMPLYIPEGSPDRSGELVLIPNLRPFRRSVVMNMLGKLLWQNGLARRLLSKSKLRDRFNAKLLRLKPGSLYLFWGYRTLHGNLPCEVSSLRATALFHFGDPHARSPITRGIVGLRKLRERLNARQPQLTAN